MKYKVYFFTFLLFSFLSFTSYSQSTNGIKISSSGWTPIYCVTSDSAGNYYSIGSFHTSVTFDSAGTNKTFSSSYSESLFIVKYNCSNRYVWAMIIENTARWTLMPSIKYKYGSLYATTSFDGSTSIISTNGSTTSKSCSGTLGGLIMKLTTDGVLVWANILESSTTKAELNDIDVSKTGDIYVAGMFFGTGKIYGQNSTTITTSSSSGQEDDVYMKFNKYGEIKWAKEGKSVGDDVGAFLHVDNDDNLYINHQVGCCSNYTVTFGSNSFTNNTSWGFALTKIDTGNGSTDWFTSIPGEALALGGVTTDEKGFLYSVGTFSGSKTINGASGGNSVSISSNGQWDFYIAKYTRQGKLVWAKSFGSTGNDYGNRCVYKDGKIYLNLTYSSSFTINTGTSYSFSNSGGSDDAIVIFDTTGACQGGYKITGTSSSRSLSLDYSPIGQLIIVGSFNGTITSGGKSLTSTGGNDNAFIFVYDSANTSSFIQNKSNILCNGDSVKLMTGISTGSLSWSPGYMLSDSTSSTPTTRTTNNTNFVLKYTTPEGCVYYDTAKVFFKSCVTCDSNCNKTVGNNLLKNGDFEKGDSNFSASPYTYYSASPMTQGEYIVTSNPSSCHFGFSGTDHTSGSGKMMVLNGWNTYRGVFYKQSIAVKKNTCYKITAWLNNIVDASYTGLAEAYIRFRLNNDSSSTPVQVKQFPDQWIKLETTWYSDTCTVLNYMLDDTSSAGNGNDFAIDDLSVYECGCTIVYNNTAGPDTTICSGSTYTLPTPSGNKWKYSVLSGDFSGLQGSNTASPNTTTHYLLTDSSASCNSYDTVTIKITNAPVLSHMSNKTICRGDSVQLITTAGYQYKWTPGSELSDSTIYNPYAKPNLSKDYKVVVSSGGCSSVDSVSIVVNGKPASSDIIQAICKFDSLQLQANGPANTFSWAPSSGLSSATIANPKASPTTNTKYICTMSNSSGCIGYDTVNVIVEIVTPDAGKDTTICAGQSIQLQATGGVNYSWSPSTGLNNASINNPIASPSTSTTFIVSVSAQYGCTKVDTINIVVKNIVVKAGNDITLCNGDSTQLVATGGETYKWTPSSGLSDDTTFNPIAKPLITTEYIVTGFTSNGCSRSDTVVVTVSNLKAFAGNDTTICGSDSIQLNASGGTTYSWSPTIGISDPNIPNPKVLPPSNTDYIVYVTNGGSCSGYDTISISLKPKATVVGGGTFNICIGDTIQLDIQSGTGNYTWNTGDTDSYIVVQPNQNTKYTVVSAPSGYCSSDTTSYNVLVRQKPSVAFIADPREGTKPLTVHFTNNTTNANSYIWHFGNGDTDIVNSPSYIYQQSGTYSSTLIATNQYGCIDSASLTIIVRDSFYLFLPNSFTPNNNKKNDVFVIDYDKNNVLEGYIKIYNRWGEKVYESDLLNYQPWDGSYRDKQVQEDVYLLILYVTDKNRTEYHHTATLTILR